MLADRLCQRLVGPLIGLCIATGSVSFAAANEQSDAARQVVDSLHNQLFEVAGDDSLNFDERVDKLTPVVSASYDFQYISRFILRRSWSGLEPGQQSLFVSAFERLSVANYASRFTELDEQSLVVTDVSPAARERVQVDARLQLPDDELDLVLSYTLTEGKGGDWAIINLIADGVSDLALRRAEYSRVLKDKGFDGLLVHIDGQIADLK